MDGRCPYYPTAARQVLESVPSLQNVADEDGEVSRHPCLRRGKVGHAPNLCASLGEGVARRLADANALPGAECLRHEMRSGSDSDRWNSKRDNHAECCTPRPFEGHPHFAIPRASIEVMQLNPLPGTEGT